MIPYYYNEDSFLQHEIITKYLEGGIDAIFDKTKLKTQLGSTLIEQLATIYYNLGFIDKPTNQGQAEILVKEYLQSIINKEPQIKLSEMELQAIPNSNISSYRNTLSREIEVVANEIVAVMANKMNQEVFFNGSMSLSGLLSHYKIESMDIDELGQILFSSESKYQIVNGKDQKNFLATISSSGKGKCKFYPGKEITTTKNKKELLSAIRKRLIKVKEANCNALYTSSDDSIYNLVDKLIKDHGNLINVVKAAVRSREMMKGNKENATALMEWLMLNNLYLESNRISVYDLVSDIYFAGKTDSNKRRIIYGNYDVNKTFSVTIATGTFKTTREFLEPILNMRSLRIDPTNGNRLMSGNNTDVWIQLLGTTQPKDGNVLNISKANVKG